MIHSVRGIVLNYVKYKESSIICKIFTDRFGLQSYIIHGARSSKGKNKIALYQPLSILELEVYHNSKKDIQRISEAKTIYFYQDLKSNFTKTTLSLFITEIISKCCTAEEEQYHLFESMMRSFIFFDQSTGKTTNIFHLYFMVLFLKENGFISSAEQVDSNLSSSMNQLNTEELLLNAQIPNLEKRRCLEQLVLFYKEHLSVNGFRSLEIIRDLF